MTQDISHNVVAILLILTMVVAGFGTWAVVDAQSDVQQPSPNTAQVSLSIDRPSAGEVSIQIEEPEEEQQ